jgi:predicted nicotinamide N-methyase
MYLQRCRSCRRNLTLSSEVSIEAFVKANTALHEPPLVPEIRLHLASEIVPIWQMTEEELERTGLPPPFWAFAWAGGQALARYVLDNPQLVAGRSILDFGAGSGIVGIAAALAGAASVLCADIDPFACEVMKINSLVNAAALQVTSEDLIGTLDGGWDVVLIGDMCYEQPLSQRIEIWIHNLVGRGTLVLIGDPGRTYLPKTGLERITTYAVKTTRELEDTDVRSTSVWQAQ